MTNRYQSLSTLVNVTSAALVLYAVSSVLVGVSSLNMLSALEPGPLDITRIVESMSPWMPIGTIDSLLSLILVVLFSVWVYRANANARALGAQGMRFSSGWAVGWFFVPIMNLFRPYQVVREIWKASDPEVSSQWDQLQTPGLVKAWWATLLVSWIGIHLTNPSITHGLVTVLMAASAINLLAHVGSCILALLLVRCIHRRQEARAARVLTGIGG
jgi:Domain of unknown function (DUF4328)